MKILSAKDIRAWDQATLTREPIASIDLMERASGKCVNWLEERLSLKSSFHIFCGKGNNGGDGLAIARMFAARAIPLSVHILEFGHKGTDDFQVNLARLHQHAGVEIHFIQAIDHFPTLQRSDIVIDALFGSGLNRPLEGVTAQLVEHVNASHAAVIAIDIPSGLFTNHSSKGNAIIRATVTLSFQCLKPAFLMAENASFIGEMQVLDIGLDTGFYEEVSTLFESIDPVMVHDLYRPRNRFAHKGNFGHALVVAGSYGKIGAAVLSAKACLRSGVGLLSCHIPSCGYEVLQTAVPEAMVSTDFNSSFTTKLEDDPGKYASIGIGPGLGTASETKALLRKLLESYRRPLVLDADALNILATDPELMQLIPRDSILTPHPKEFVRLFGESANDFDRVELALQKARELNVVIALKGHHTLVATPGGKAFFNCTGNAGMATGGSGDVLTGLLTGLLTQGYSSVEAALLGVYLHGTAGDRAAERYSEEALIAGDIIDCFGEAFREISQL